MGRKTKALLLRKPGQGRVRVDLGQSGPPAGAELGGDADQVVVGLPARGHVVR